MLAPMKTSRPAIRNGSLTAATIRSRDRGGRLDGRVVQQHRELVAAEPGRGVAGPDAAADPVGHRGQQLVAGLVAEAVVDRLEPVQVDEEHAGRLGRLAPRRQHPVEDLQEQAAVRQAGHRVVVRLADRLDRTGIGQREADLLGERGQQVTLLAGALGGAAAAVRPGCRPSRR